MNDKPIKKQIILECNFTNILIQAKKDHYNHIFKIKDTLFKEMLDNYLK
jgi:hypothetical protein